MPNKIFLIAHLALDTNHIGGQTIKSRNILEAIRKDGFNVQTFDTYLLKINKLKIITLLLVVLKYENIIIIPARNNLKYFVPYLYLCKLILRKNITLIGVGGWLDVFVEKYKVHQFILKRIGPILVQNKSLAHRLNKLFSFDNVSVLHNFKTNTHKPLLKKNSHPKKIFFLSRIMPEKGSELIFDLCDTLIDKQEHNDILIDFIGPVDDQYEEKFLNKVDKYNFVRYQGPIQPDELYNILDGYDLLLFPTKYIGEGFPGVILDAFNLGIPVITTKWRDIPEFIDHGKNGYLIEVDDLNSMYFYFKKIISDEELLYQLKINAYKSREKYSVESGMNILKKYIGQPY